MAAAIVALVGAAAAWGSIFVNRAIATKNVAAQINIAARNSRAAVVSANRQRWIDAIRDDIADIIATRKQLDNLMSAGSFEQSGVDVLNAEERQLVAKLNMLQARIDLRLNHLESDHLNLIERMVLFSRSGLKADEECLKSISRKIFSDEWHRLKKEASGIEPIVQEIKKT